MEVKREMMPLVRANSSKRAGTDAYAAFAGRDANAKRTIQVHAQHPGPLEVCTVCRASCALGRAAGKGTWCRARSGALICLLGVPQGREGMCGLTEDGILAGRYVMHGGEHADAAVAASAPAMCARQLLHARRSLYSAAMQDALDAVEDVREYDVPFHMRFAIDTDVRCGHWYTVRVTVLGPSLQQDVSMGGAQELSVKLWQRWPFGGGSRLPSSVALCQLWPATAVSLQPCIVDLIGGPCPMLVLCSLCSAG